MQPFIETLTIVLPIFLVIGLGTLLKKFRLFDETFLQQTNRLVYVVFLPLLLFYKIGKADFSSFFNAPLVIGSSLVIALGFTLSYLYSGNRRYSAAIQGSFSQGSFRGNLAYIGLAICLNAYGEVGLTKAGILMGFLVPVLNLFAILALLLPHHGKGDEKTPNLIAQTIFNPLIIASFLGIVWSYWSLPIPIIIDRSINITTGLALPLALLAIGGSFSLEKLRGDLVLAAIASTIKLALLPLLAFLLLVPMGVSGSDLGIGILIAGTPAATATYIMAQQMKGDADLAGSIVMLSTLASAFSYTIILLIFKSYGLL
ncbi:AEC family transporter [uncultured Desulfuromusa sp.]|uniref:AEC family transporter n=1 Tax=uncultured Desulfuromusa sp. TaxID=219183 RepID=UPI002AA6C714|nr:AEC family transporter [uncultured Desulfuromusa sp.]